MKLKEFSNVSYGSFGSDMLDKIKSIIKNSILENKDKIIEMFSQYLEENVDFKGIIVKM